MLNNFFIKKQKLNSIFNLSQEKSQHFLFY